MDLKCFEMYGHRESIQTSAQSRKSFIFPQSRSDSHLCLQPVSAKCQADKSQGLRVKWNINILTNRAESQESITLSSPTGDDFIPVLACFSFQQS